MQTAVPWSTSTHAVTLHLHGGHTIAACRTELATSNGGATPKGLNGISCQSFLISPSRLFYHSVSLF